MPLPNLEKMVPTFPVTIPSTQQVVTFRPFLVKEEKILLIALEANDEKAMLDAVIQVVSACTIGPGLKMDTLSNFDLEFIFLQLRARSVNEVVELSYKCHNTVEHNGKEVSCDNIVKLALKLDDIQVKFNPEHSKQILLTDTMGINMRYPTYKMEKVVVADKKDNKAGNNISETFNRIAMCVESVFDDQSVYTNFTTKEISEWIEKLSQSQFLKLQDFFETMPKLEHDVPFSCPKCGYEETLHLEGLASFFV